MLKNRIITKTCISFKNNSCVASGFTRNEHNQKCSQKLINKPSEGKVEFWLFGIPKE